MNRFYIVALVAGLVSVATNMTPASAATLGPMPDLKQETQIDKTKYRDGYYGNRFRYHADRRSWRYAPVYRSWRGYRNHGYGNWRSQRYGHDHINRGWRQYY